MNDSIPGGGAFPATHHSVVLRAAQGGESERAAAAERLTEAYWKPVYKYVRLRWRQDAERAADLTQGFFTGVCEKEFWSRYDRTRAAFRTFLRTCVDHFVSNELAAERRIKRGGGLVRRSLDFLSAEEELRGAGLREEADPDAWMQAEFLGELLRSSVEAFRADCHARGRMGVFSVFEAYDLRRDAPGAPSTYAELASLLGLTVSQVTNGLHTARREFRAIVLARLAELCADQDEFELERRALFGDADET